MQLNAALGGALGETPGDRVMACGGAIEVPEIREYRCRQDSN